jgi:Mrp family chromosome partitioning ATPase
MEAIAMAAEQTPAPVPDLVVVREPDSPGAQAYRSVRETLRHAQTDVPVRSLLLADAGSGDQTGEASANIAASFALNGERTVLIDLDAARPVINSLVNGAASPGLIDWLAAERAASGKRPVPHPSGIEDLTVLPAGERGGSGPQAPLADLLTDTRCRALIQTLEADAHYVVFHASVAPITSQALTVAANVDAVVLIVRSGITRRTDAQNAKESLERVGATLLGVVLTED